MATAPILRYALTTDPFPLQASPQSGNLTTATLTVVASNPTPNPVTLQGLIVTLPVGDGSTDLTPDAASISPIAPANWTLEPNPQGGKFVFHPNTGHGAVGSEGLKFVFNTVEINRQTGTVAVEIMEGSNNCTPPDCPTKTLDLTKFPNGWGKVSFWTHKPNIQYDNSTTLHWKGPQGATYTIEYYTQQTGVVTVPSTGQPPLSNSGEYPLTLTQTTIFTLNVEERIDNQPYQAQRQVTVTVAPPLKPLPEITQFTGKIEMVGTTISLVLTWKTKNATKWAIPGIPEYLVNPTGVTFSPSVENPLQTTYTLKATNDAKESATSTVTVEWGQEALQIQVGSGPMALAITPHGTLVFVAITGDTISVLESMTGSISVLGQPIKVGNAPLGIAVSPRGTAVLVSNTASGTISMLDPATRPIRVQETIQIGQQRLAPYGVACATTPQGPLAFVANNGENSVSILKITSDSIKLTGKPIPVGVGPQAVAVTPDGTRVFVANINDKTVSVLEVTTDSVKVGKPVPVGKWPVGIAITPDGSRVFVTNSGSNTVSVFEASTLQPVGKPIKIGGGPTCVAISHDGARIFVASGTSDGIVSVLDNTTNPIRIIGQSIKVGPAPIAMAVSPDGSQIFVANSNSNTVSVVVPTSVIGGIGS